MAPLFTLASRSAEMQRRLTALPTELAQWRQAAERDYDPFLHGSHIHAICTLVQATLEVATAELPLEPPSFYAELLNTTGKLARIQWIWDFFRDRLSQRLLSYARPTLSIADAVAWQLYQSVIERAVAIGAFDKARRRAPPLTYMDAVVSPSTWVSEDRTDGASRFRISPKLLPFHIIVLPWDYGVNGWNLVVVAHEVAHALVVDLRLAELLRTRFSNGLGEKGIPPERSRFWARWWEEVVCDLVALRLMGPAFAEALMNALLLPQEHVTLLSEQGEHPMPYLRVLLCCEYLRTLLPDGSLAAAADAIAGRWQELYGAPAMLSAFAPDFPAVWQLLMETKLDGWLGKSIADLLPYSTEDDRGIRAVAGYLESGTGPAPTLSMAHCVSAARLAATEAARRGDGLAGRLDGINQRMFELARSAGSQSKGARGPGASKEHTRMLRSLAGPLLAELMEQP